MSEVRGKNWDQYWIDSAKSKGLFEIIAKFYRRYIISPAVRHYFHKYFRDEPWAGSTSTPVAAAANRTTASTSSTLDF